VQLYYSGTGIQSNSWTDGEHSGDVRCATGYVLAAESIHPESGEAYEVLIDAPVAAMLDIGAFTPQRKISLTPADGKLSDPLTVVEAIGWPHTFSQDGSQIFV
jgi:hypothetical protein